MADTSANKAIVQRYWDALAARDYDAMKALLTEDAHYTDVGTPGDGGTGPEGVVARLKIGLEPLEGYDRCYVDDPSESDTPAGRMPCTGEIITPAAAS